MEEVLVNQFINTEIINQLGVIDLYKFIGALVMKYGDDILQHFNAEWAANQFRRLYPGMSVPADLTYLDYLDLDVGGLVRVESNKWYYNLKFQYPIVKAVVHSSYRWILTLDGNLYRTNSNRNRELVDSEVVNLFGYSDQKVATIVDRYSYISTIVYITEDNVTNFLFYRDNKQFDTFSRTLGYKITSIGNNIFCTNQGEVYVFEITLGLLEADKLLFTPPIKEIHGDILVSQDGRFFTPGQILPSEVQGKIDSGEIVDFTEDGIRTIYDGGLRRDYYYAQYIGTELSANNGKTIYATDDIHSIDNIMIVRETKTILLVYWESDNIIVSDVTNTYPLVLSEDPQIYYDPLYGTIITSITNQVAKNKIQVYLALLFPRLAYRNRQMLFINASGWSQQTMQWLESPVEYSDQDTVTIQSWLDNTTLSTSEYKVNDLRTVAQWLLLLRNNYPGEGFFDRVELDGPTVKIIYHTV